MIVLDQVTLSVPIHRRTRLTLLTKRRHILDHASIVIPTDRRIALIGPSREDNSAVIDLLGGVVVPNRGRVRRGVKVSFPVGHLGSFDNELTARKNVAHLARLYGQKVDVVVDFVQRASRLGSRFNEQFGHLSRTEMTQLASLVAYAIPFDVYVLNGNQANMIRSPRDPVSAMFRQRAQESGIIVPVRSPQFALEHCDMAMYLNDGQLQMFDKIDDALSLLQGRRRLRRERHIEEAREPERTDEEW